MTKGRTNKSRTKKVHVKTSNAVAEDDTTTITNRIFICGHHGCNDIVTTGKFCRFHYLATWKKAKQDEAKGKGQKLEAYLSDLSQRFPEDFLERLKGEIEEMSLEGDKEDTSSDKGSSFFDQPDDSSDTDMDTIIKGIRVEDF